MRRYVDEFSGPHNERPLDTVDQMAPIGRRAAGKPDDKWYLGSPLRYAGGKRLAVEYRPGPQKPDRELNCVVTVQLLRLRRPEIGPIGRSKRTTDGQQEGVRD